MLFRSNVKEIEKAITDLNKEIGYKEVKDKIDEKYRKEVEPIKNIYEKCSKDVEVKLFIDQKKWDVSDNFKPDYEDFTKWLKDEK